MSTQYSITPNILLDNISAAATFAKDHFNQKHIPCTIDKKNYKGFPILTIKGEKYILKVTYHGPSLIEHVLPTTFKATPPFKTIKIVLDEF